MHLYTPNFSHCICKIITLSLVAIPKLKLNTVVAYIWMGRPRFFRQYPYKQKISYLFLTHRTWIYICKLGFHVFCTCPKIKNIPMRIHMANNILIYVYPKSHIGWKNCILNEHKIIGKCWLVTVCVHYRIDLFPGDFQRANDKQRTLSRMINFIRTIYIVWRQRSQCAIALDIT